MSVRSKWEVPMPSSAALCAAGHGAERAPAAAQLQAATQGGRQRHTPSVLCTRDRCVLSGLQPLPRNATRSACGRSKPPSDWVLQLGSSNFEVDLSDNLMLYLFSVGLQCARARDEPRRRVLLHQLQVSHVYISSHHVGSENSGQLSTHFLPATAAY